jgi:L-malate glycosyltransferase
MTNLSSKPRVLMLTQYLGIGGMERMILSLCGALKHRALAEPVVFAYDLVEGSNYLCSEFARHEVPVVLMKKASGFSWRTVRHIAAAVRSYNIDLIHSHNLGSLMYASMTKLLLRGRARLVHTQHSFIHLKEKRRYALYERVFCRAADALTVVSEDTRKTYMTLGLPGKRIDLIENGVSFPDEPRLSQSDREQARKALIDSYAERPFAEVLSNFRADRWILCLARLHPEKGQRHALKIWRALAPEVRRRSLLLFVGPDSTPGETGKLRRECAELPDSGRVLFTGGMPDPQAWLHACDAYLSCSEFEGMPLGPLEAAGSGLPVILSRIPGHEFLAAHSTLFDLNDPAQGARALEHAVRELDSRGESFCRELWDHSRPLVERFSLDRMTEQYAQIYRRVLGI